ncbi:inner membrane protein [Escherichia coli]|uniref:Inner membrane protein n=1 Tax=Escherichia coli TaxID=562 RepID=A0A376TQQ0_ECOLX|nr:inner membrane protein [Escherichia coli]
MNRSVGTVVGLIIAGVALHFKIPEGYTLTLMLITTLASYLILRKKLRLGDGRFLPLPQCIPCNCCG